MEPGPSWTPGKGRWENRLKRNRRQNQGPHEPQELEPAGWNNTEKENDAIGIKLGAERCQIPVPNNLPWTLSAQWSVCCSHNPSRGPS